MVEINEEVVNEEVTLSEEDTIVSDFKVIESSNPYVLGVLEGVFMVIEEDNGNGRWYQKDTIVQKILEDEYVKRMLAAKALLGESHHPLDRTSIWSDEACICTRELWIDSTGKYLMGRADILDTPKGRIVYTLAKYGTKLGISARANGQGVKQKGRLVIKPQNYFFKTFDVVLNPGFKVARPTILESDGKTPLKVFEECEDPMEGLFEELQEMVTKKTCDTKMLKEYIEYSESDKLRELIPIMEDVSTEPSGDDTSTSAELNEELMEELRTLREKVKKLDEGETDTTQIRMKYEEKIKDLRAVNEELMISNEELEGRLEIYTEIVEEQERYAFESNSLVEELMSNIQTKDKEISKYTRIIKLYEEMNTELDEKVTVLNEEKAELSRDICSLNESVDELEDVLKEINEEQVYEEVKEVPQKLFNKKVNLFNSTHATLNEEVTRDEVTSNKKMNRISMIKTLGGK